MAKGAVQRKRKKARADSKEEFKNRFKKKFFSFKKKKSYKNKEKDQ